MANGSECNHRLYPLATALVYFIFMFFVNNVNGRKTQDLIYQNIDGFSTCVRRFNATHQTGCSTSTEEGNTGVLHYINDTHSLDWLLTIGPEKPYIPLLTAEMFTQENIMSLWNSGKINGLMVIHTNADEEAPSSFSPDYSCPNENYGWYTDDANAEYAHCSKTEWNPDGHKSQPLLYFDFQQTPIFALTSEEGVNNLLQCYFKWNQPIGSQPRGYPLCAVSLSSRNFGAVDTPTCMRRTSLNGHSITQTVTYCDPLGGHNVWGTINPTNKSQPLEKESVIVVASKLDSTSLFESVTPVPGAENDLTGFVVALSVAEALGRLPRQAKDNFIHNIMFTFFQGETYDYIGSSRMVYDMEAGQFPQTPDDRYQEAAPMNLSHISHFVELRQLGLPHNHSYWLHTDPVTQANTPTKTKTDALIEQMSRAGGELGLTLEVADPALPLPPASFQRFLRSNLSIAGLLVTDHNQHFSNRYYNSRFDLSGPIGIDYVNQTEDYVPPVVEKVNNLSTAIARSLYALAYPDGKDEVTANISITNELLYCFLYDPNCSLFQRTLVGSGFPSSLLAPNKPFNRYVSVYREGNLHPNTATVRHLLEYFLGEKYPVNENFTCSGDASNHILSYRKVDGDSVCVVSGVQVSLALSPAFKLNQWDSTEYSTWTESVWTGAFSARLFLVVSKSQQSTLLSIGVVIFLVSGLIIYFIDKKAAILFATADLY